MAKGDTSLDNLLYEVDTGRGDLEAGLCTLEELREVQQKAAKGIARQKAKLTQQCAQEGLWHVFDLNEGKLRRHIQNQR